MQGLKSLLRQMHTQLRELAVSLEEEQRVLIDNHSIKRLDDIIQQKNRHLVELKILDEQRIEMEKNLDMFAPYHEIEELAPRWEIILQMTQELSMMNKKNGELLQKHLDNTEKKIHVLNSLNKNELYDADGQKQKYTSSFKRTAV